MYKARTEPDAGRTGTKTENPDTPAQARKNRPRGGRGLAAFAIMLAVAAAGYALMFAAVDLLIKG